MHYFIGWDVGGWNCDHNRHSQDALAVLANRNGNLRVLGSVFRGPIREDINGLTDFASFAEFVNSCCETEITDEDEITIAIDTPLGFPSAVEALVKKEPLPKSVPEESCKNPYLYRQTERWLFSQGFTPLSAIKDMIGSQATKGMHFLRKLDLSVSDDECGVWRGCKVTAIEAYPATCRRSNNVHIRSGSESIQEMFRSLNGRSELRTADEEDAVYCALIAYLFAQDKERLIGPQENPPVSEGWIWIPTDSVSQFQNRFRIVNRQAR